MAKQTYLSSLHIGPQGRRMETLSVSPAPSLIRRENADEWAGKILPGSEYVAQCNNVMHYRRASDGQEVIFGYGDKPFEFAGFLLWS